jgi:hypothetical protein
MVLTIGVLSRTDLMRGVARWGYQHSIVPVTQLR